LQGEAGADLRLFTEKWGVSVKIRFVIIPND
jgi:hypothetical protein